MSLETITYTIGGATPEQLKERLREEVERTTLDLTTTHWCRGALQWRELTTYQAEFMQADDILEREFEVKSGPIVCTAKQYYTYVTFMYDEQAPVH